MRDTAFLKKAPPLDPLPENTLIHAANQVNETQFPECGRLLKALQAADCALSAYPHKKQPPNEALVD